MLSSNISPRCPYNMVNFGPLAAEIVSLVWGTQANFNEFRVLAALPHSQTVALNGGRHLYSAGRPSRWALAHISSSSCVITAPDEDIKVILILISYSQMFGRIHSVNGINDKRSQNYKHPPGAGNSRIIVTVGWLEFNDEVYLPLRPM